MISVAFYIHKKCQPKTDSRKIMAWSRFGQNFFFSPCFEHDLFKKHKIAIPLTTTCAYCQLFEGRDR